MTACRPQNFLETDGTHLSRRVRARLRSPLDGDHFEWRTRWRAREIAREDFSHHFERERDWRGRLVFSAVNCSIVPSSPSVCRLRRKGIRGGLR